VECFLKPPLKLNIVTVTATGNVIAMIGVTMTAIGIVGSRMNALASGSVTDTGIAMHMCIALRGRSLTGLMVVPAAVTITMKSRRGIVMDSIEAKRMFVIEGLSIRTTPAIIEVAMAHTARDFVEGMNRAIASTVAIADGNHLNRKLKRLEQTVKIHSVCSSHAVIKRDSTRQSSLAQLRLSINCYAFV
jgi:hypothetical protein